MSHNEYYTYNFEHNVCSANRAVWVYYGFYKHDFSIQTLPIRIRSYSSVHWDIFILITVPQWQSSLILCSRALLQIFDRGCILDERCFWPSGVHERQTERTRTERTVSQRNWMSYRLELLFDRSDRHREEQEDLIAGYHHVEVRHQSRLLL